MSDLLSNIQNDKQDCFQGGVHQFRSKVIKKQLDKRNKTTKSQPCGSYPTQSNKATKGTRFVCLWVDGPYFERFGCGCEI